MAESGCCFPPRPPLGALFSHSHSLSLTLTLSYLRKGFVFIWAIDHPFVWNTLTKSTSVLEVALMRALKVDLGIAAGLHAFAGLIDIKKFSDNIRISSMIEAGLKLDCCPIVMYMALLMHLAPRVLCVPAPAGHYFTDPIHMSCWSLLAGCVTIIDFTKLVLSGLLDRMCLPYPTAPINIWVADLVPFWLGKDLNTTAVHFV